MLSGTLQKRFWKSDKKSLRLLTFTKKELAVVSLARMPTTAPWMYLPCLLGHFRSSVFLYSCNYQVASDSGRSSLLSLAFLPVEKVLDFANVNEVENFLTLFKKRLLKYN